MGQAEILKVNMADIQPNLSSVTRISDLDLPEPSNAVLLKALQEASKYLSYYKWVSRIDEQFLGYAAEGIIYIFLFKILPNRVDVDSWIWVIVGDVPPAYITCEDAKTPAEALDGYIGAMEEWVETALRGKSVSRMIPVNVPATPENAELLRKRLEFLNKEILAPLWRYTPRSPGGVH